MRRAAAVLGLLGVMAGATLAQDKTVAMADLTKDPASFVGQTVTIPDCLVLGFNTIVGAQCTVKPMDPAVLVYIDADTWTPETATTIQPCDGMDISKLCLLKVTGEVAQNSAGQALIKNAKIELLEQTSAF